MKKKILLLGMFFLSFFCMFSYDEVEAAGTANDIVNVAKKEVGNAGVPNKYTRDLGSINGSYSYAWCHAFVSWCAKNAGCTNLVPRTAGCDKGVSWFKSRGQWKNRISGYIPKAGDIIYFDYGANGTYDHVGIVTGTGNGRVYTIEGNARNQVKVNGGYSNGYALNSSDILGYGTPAYSSQAQGTGHNPVAALDSVTGLPGGIRVTGWAYDEDDLSKSLDIHVYVGGEAGTGAPCYPIVANAPRVDIGLGNYHGFNREIKTSLRGRQAVYVYAINVGAGNNVLIGSGTVDISNEQDPVADLDMLTGIRGGIKVAGWAYDEDDLSKSLDIHVYIGGDAGTGAPCYPIVANAPRVDIGRGNYHGFNKEIKTSLRGRQTVYVYAINVGAGNNALIGSKIVDISNEQDPVADLDTLTGIRGGIKVAGWAYDEDNLSKSLDIHVYIGGDAGSGAPCYPIVANVPRVDIGRGNYHGFNKEIKTSLRGRQTVYVYAINVGAGNNVLIGSKTVDISNEQDPVADLDTLTGIRGGIKVAGWAYDEDNLSKSLDIHVYIGGDASSGAPCYPIVANVPRVDIGRGNYHGYDSEIKTPLRGNQTVYVYAINVGAGKDILIASKKVMITGDDEKPVISNLKITDLNESGYTVSCKVTDNVSVERVAFLTWTINNGQDDILQGWKTDKRTQGIKSGDVYTFRVNVSDHKNESGSYRTQIYAWDADGNQAIKELGDITVRTEHTIVIDPAVAATCEKAGKTEGSHCSVCGQVIDPQMTIDKTDHSWGEEEILLQPTTEKQGIKQYTCVNCGTRKIETIEKSDGSNETLEPSDGDVEKPIISDIKVTDLNENGYTISCKVTDNVGIDHVAFLTWTVNNGQDDILEGWETDERTQGIKNGDVYTFRVNVSDHGNESGSYCTYIYAWDTDGNQAIKELDEITVKAEHTIVIDPAIEATCQNEGKTEGSHCSVCGQVLNPQLPIEKTGHHWGEEEILLPPTAEKQGVRQYTCIICGVREIEIIERSDGSNETSEPSDRNDDTDINGDIVKDEEQNKLIDLSDNATIKLSDTTYTYKGKVIRPNIRVILQGKSLKQGVDYQVSYAQNDWIGQATVTVTGIGDYCGEVLSTFKIIPPKIVLRKARAEKKGFTVYWKRPVDEHVSYEVQYSKNKNFVKKGRKSTFVEYVDRHTVKNLDKNKKYYVRVRACKKVSGKVYASPWSKVITVKTK